MAFWKQNLYPDATNHNFFNCLIFNQYLCEITKWGHWVALLDDNTVGGHILPFVAYSSTQVKIGYQKSRV